jgi:hypothetical protein
MFVALLAGRTLNTWDSFKESSPKGGHPDGDYLRFDDHKFDDIYDVIVSVEPC